MGVKLAFGKWKSVWLGLFVRTSGDSEALSRRYLVFLWTFFSFSSYFSCYTVFLWNSSSIVNIIDPQLNFHALTWKLWTFVSRLKQTCQPTGGIKHVSARGSLRAGFADKKCSRMHLKQLVWCLHVVSFRSPMPFCVNRFIFLSFRSARCMPIYVHQSVRLFRFVFVWQTFQPTCFHAFGLRLTLFTVWIRCVIIFYCDFRLWSLVRHSQLNCAVSLFASLRGETFLSMSPPDYGPQHVCVAHLILE